MIGYIIWAAVIASGILVALFLSWLSGYAYGYDQRGRDVSRTDWQAGYQEGRRAAEFGERIECAEASARWLN